MTTPTDTARLREDLAWIARHPYNNRAKYTAVNSLPALLDEVDRLRAAEADWAIERAIGQRQLDELRSALKPFATLGGMLTGTFAPALFPDDRPVGMGGAWSENGEPRTVTFGDLRRARLALEPKP